jgi:hypothetical protein
VWGSGLLGGSLALWFVFGGDRAFEGDSSESSAVRTAVPQEDDNENNDSGMGIELCSASQTHEEHEKKSLVISPLQQAVGN